MGENSADEYGGLKNLKEKNDKSLEKFTVSIMEKKLISGLTKN